MYCVLHGITLSNEYVLYDGTLSQSCFADIVCIADAGNMYSYGASQNDVSLPPLDDYSHGPINIPLGCFPFGLQRHHSVYVRTNL